MQDCPSESRSWRNPLSTARDLLAENTAATAFAESAAATSAAASSAADGSLILGRLARWRLAVQLGLEDPSSSITATTAHYVVVCLILASTLCAVLVTVRELEEAHFEIFNYLEEFFTVFFTLEIFLRMWTATSFVAYISSPSNLVDILATLPWYGEVAYQHLWYEPGKDQKHFKEVADSFRTLRVARLFRMVRLAKVARHFETVPLVLESILASRGGLFILVACVGFGTVLSATAVYAVESENPHGDFNSVPAAMWWALTTITTVGYGDMVPESVGGKFIGSATMVGGTLIVSLSVATITSSFTENYRLRSDMAKYKKAMLQRQQKARQEEATHLVPKIERVESRLLVNRIASLEEEIKDILYVLEGELHSSESAEPENTVSALFTNGTQFSVTDPSPTPASLLLDSLRSQSGTLFKSIRGLAEHTAVVGCTTAMGCCRTGSAGVDTGVAAAPTRSAIGGRSPMSPVPASVRSLSFGPPVVPPQASPRRRPAPPSAAAAR